MARLKIWKPIIILTLALLIAGCSKGKREKTKKAVPSQSQPTVSQAPQTQRIRPSPELSGESLSTPPQIVDIHLDPPLPVTGDKIKAVVQVDDAHTGNTTIKYQWLVNGEPVEEKGPILNHPVKRGDKIEVKVVAWSDSLKSNEVIATTVVGNAPPIIELQHQEVEGDRYIATLKVEDPEGDPVTLELRKGPPGMVIDQEKKRLTWNTAGVKPGVPTQYNIEISAKDDQGAETILTFPLKVEAKNVANTKG